MCVIRSLTPSCTYKNIAPPIVADECHASVTTVVSSLKASPRFIWNNADEALFGARAGNGNTATPVKFADTTQFACCVYEYDDIIILQYYNIIHILIYIILEYWQYTIFLCIGITPRNMYNAYLKRDFLSWIFTKKYRCHQLL